MRRSTLVLTAVGISAAAVTGSAFTASNDLDVGNKVVGYGQAHITGAVATAIDYNPLSSDETYLDSVDIELSTDITGQTATLTLKNASEQPIAGSPFQCDLGAWNTGSGRMTINCPVAATTQVKFSDFDYVGLTVHD